MTPELAIGPLLGALETYLWPFVRIGAFAMVMPVLAGSFVPQRIRLMLAIVLTAAIAPLVPEPPPVDVLTLPGFVLMLREIATGVLMGFTLQILFDAIALGGQVIAMSMGLGFAVFVDRQRGVNIPVLGQLFLMLGMLVFLSLNGHLALIRLLAESFQILPMTGGGLSRAAVGGVLEWSGQLFVVAAAIALPAVTALIVVNLSFGVMSRAAPTLNLFAVGFPVAMLLGFAVIFLSMENLTASVSRSLDAALAALPRLLAS